MAVKSGGRRVVGEEMFIQVMAIVADAGIIFFFQSEDGIRDFCLSRGLGDVYNETAIIESPIRGKYEARGRF